MMIAKLLLSVLFFSSSSGASATCPKQANLGVTAPKMVQALSGSCLQIPCNFTAKPAQKFDGRGKIFGVWIKNDSRFARNPTNVVFNSSGKVNTYTMNITGNLSQKNCNTLFSNVLTSYTDTYYFRIESNSLIATASCDPLRIVVKDSPPRPRIEISGKLREASSVTVTCSAFTPCPHSPPKLTWSLQKDPRNNMVENADGTFTAQIQESITLTDKHDGLNITCSAVYPVNGGKNIKTAEETRTLSVLYAPKNTLVSISPPGLVSAGTMVNLTCSSRAKPSVKNFTWFRISNSLSIKVSEGEFYSFNATDGGTFYCEATNDLSKQKSPEVRLNIKGGRLLDSSSLWGLIVGGMIGIILISLAVMVWWFKSKRSAFQQTQSLTAGEPAAKEQARAADKEDIHYGEIDFSKLRPGSSSDSGHNSGPQQNTVYAQVKVSKPVISLQQAAGGGTEDLYAQVKRK